ncbi:septum formation protein Maf [Ectothiorhodospiraceae bacterium WFHF3C12]|nr:septum formation protein Maf [Ectothiorhodospiraceae bacterium WFHF3C12]
MAANGPLILASTSPYRAELLTRLGLPFERRAPDIDESARPGEAPEAYVARLAREKAMAVCATRGLVIGSDQTAVLDGNMLGKPGDPQRAVKQLLAASGRRVSFLTGLCLHDTASGDSWLDVVPYHVVFRPITEAVAMRYVEREQPLDCAGSFKAEGLGIALFQRMEGDDPTALVGLPLIRLVDFLLAAGVEVP